MGQSTSNRTQTPVNKHKMGQSTSNRTQTPVNKHEMGHFWPFLGVLIAEKAWFTLYMGQKGVPKWVKIGQILGKRTQTGQALRGTLA
jgi:hypothetical protein